MEIKLILEEQAEGGYTVYVPSLQGCISQGENIEEAIANIKEAISLYLETDENEISIYNENVKTKIIEI